MSEIKNHSAKLTFRFEIHINYMLVFSLKTNQLHKISLC